LSPANIELARRSYTAFADRDAEAFVAGFSDGVEWDVSAFVTGRSRYSGHRGVREFLADVDRLERDQGERFEVELTEFIEADDERVLGLGTGRIVREHDPLDFGAAALWRFAGDVAVEFRAYTTHEEARRAAGLD
jgi:ketosteroid isomerase-like protein